MNTLSLIYLTFWYGSYSKGDSDLEIINSPSQPAASMDWVIKVAHIDSPNSHTDHTDDLQVSTKHELCNNTGTSGLQSNSKH